MRASASSHDFRVGEWLVQPRLCRISGAGSTAHVRPKLIDLLDLLASNQGRVVGKEEILQQVWHGEFVVESVLARSIADLRRILDDRTDAPRIIETIPKRGYRLIASVERIAPRQQDEASPSLAVLPFSNLGPDADDQYFCDGMTEELTNALAAVPGLRVTARTSAFAFRGRAIDLREVGRQLGVGHVVEGSLRRAERALRVTVQLIDAGDGCHRWSGRFDRPTGDVFAIQDEIAQAIAAELKVMLLRDSEATRLRPRPPNVDAHDLYLRGRHIFALRTAAALVTAADYFARAIAADPTYAPAHAALAETYFHRAFLGHLPPAEGFPNALAAARRSLDLDPLLADGHAILAVATYAYEWEWEQAEREFRLAVRLAPSSSAAHLGLSNLLAILGRLEEATAEAELAQRLDPLSVLVRIVVAMRYCEARQLERALEHLEATLAMNPAFGTVRLHLGRAFWAMGRYEDAVDALRRAPADLPLALGLLGAALGRLGRRDEASTVLADLERLSAERHVGAVPFALIHQGLGNVDAALVWYTKAFDARDPILSVLVIDPVTDILRTNPRFAPLLGRMHLPWPAPVSERAATSPGRRRAPRRHWSWVDTRSGATTSTAPRSTSTSTRPSRRKPGRPTPG